MELEKKISPISEVTGKILVVDDDPLVLESIKIILEKEGFTIITANNGATALKVIEKEPLALIICDRKMPGIGGIEVLHEAKKSRPNASRVLLTGNADINSVIDAINLGQVNRYITKPWDNDKLVETAKSAFEKYKLVKENEVLQELILTQHKQLEDTHKSLQNELSLGGRIHEKLLLGKVPSKVPGLTIEALSVPSKEVDGDFYEFYHPVENTMDMVIGDVMGKGISAAIVATAVKMQLIRFAMPYPFQEMFDKKRGWHNNIQSTDTILKHVSSSISKKLIELEYFVSLFYCRFDMQYKKISFVDCGSAKPIHFKAKEKKAYLLNGDNYPLGIVEREIYQEKQCSFKHGDLFVFYSDGVTEARSPNGELFGTKRLLQLVEENHHVPAKDLLDLIKKTIIFYTEKNTFDDDLTLIVIKVGEFEDQERPEFSSMQFISDFSQLKTLREYVHQFCQKAPGDADRLGSEMELVVDEAFCNIVKHGYKENPKGMIHIKTELNDEGIVLNLLDQGIPFDPSTVNEPSFSGNRDTGYGWHIIKELTEKVVYTRKESESGWNQLTIFKRYNLGDSIMNFNHDIRDNVLIITPEGESLDAAYAPVFKEKVVELISDSNQKSVVFDLNKLQFIDSSGLGSFLSILRVLNSRGGDLKLSAMNKPIRTMFELVKMHKIFEIFSSKDDAIRAFKG